MTRARSRTSGPRPAPTQKVVSAVGTPDEVRVGVTTWRLVLPCGHERMDWRDNGQAAPKRKACIRCGVEELQRAGILP